MGLINLRTEALTSPQSLSECLSLLLKVPPSLNFLGSLGLHVNLCIFYPFRINIKSCDLLVTISIEPEQDNNNIGTTDDE